MSKTSPTQRSLKHLRAQGFIVAKVEQRLPIPGMFVTRDAFGFGDLLTANHEYGIALVQVTSTPNLQAREKKARAIPELVTWLKSGGRFILHGWALRGPRGKRKTYVVTVRELTLADLTAEEPVLG